MPRSPVRPEAGQPGDDLIDGGIGIDTCYQGIGTRPVVRCERPVASDPAPGPSLIPLTGILAVAFSDIDGLDGYSTGDVLIARLVDTDPGGVPSVGDTIEMGRYPMNLGGSVFGQWIDESHVVAFVNSTDPSEVSVGNASGAEFSWIREPAIREAFWEDDSSFLKGSTIRDGLDIAYEDRIYVHAESPSAPQSGLTPGFEATRPSDDAFVDVVLDS